MKRLPVLFAIVTACSVAEEEEVVSRDEAPLAADVAPCTELELLSGSFGSKTNVSSLSVEDQSGTKRTSWKYVKFYPKTEATCLMTLPKAATTPSTLTLKVNYQGPLLSRQQWRFDAYDHLAKAWVRVADNAFAQSWVWTSASIPLPAPVDRFINDGQVKMRYGTSSSGDASYLDQWVLIAGGSAQSDGGTSGGTDGGTSGGTDGGTSGGTDGGTSGGTGGGTSGGPVRAFPGAEGFGADTPGGRGGVVLEVTNLNDSGPGSLRAALSASGPRIVVFRVAGTIEVKSIIDITKPYVTIAGQTAPGDGITIKNHSTNPRGPLRIQTHDVVLRHLRIRTGGTPVDSGEIDAVTVNGGAQRIVVDHCSLSWGTDEIFQTGRAQNVTIQWSILSEGLHNSTHPKGAHSKGLHFREESGNISVHHSLLAHNYDRNPNINGQGLVDMVNNVIYNAGTSWVEVKDKFGEPTVNLVNNYFKLGPSSKSNRYEVTYYSYDLGRSPKVYVRGNIGFHRPTNDLPDNLIVRDDSRFMMVNSRFPAPAISTSSAFEAFDSVLANAGATRPVRDAHDARVLRDARNGTGRIIDAPSDVGGWLVMAPGTPPLDTDHDGMPDEWELQRGLNPNYAGDGSQDRNGDGYTNVEEYLNSLAEKQ